MAIDELNTIPKQKSVSSRALPYEQYFGEMELTEEQKEERVQLAEDFEDMMLFLFALLAVVSEFSYENIQFVVNQVESRYLSVLGEYMALDDYLNGYAKQFAENTVRTTTEHSGDAWYTSSDRAMYVAENESNTSFNYSEYRQAIEQGKTQKQWITMRDKRVRHTHAEVDGETVGIEEVFLVGTSMMMFPKDDSLGASAKEIINCRCSVKYIGNGKAAAETDSYTAKKNGALFENNTVGQQEQDSIKQNYMPVDRGNDSESVIIDSSANKEIEIREVESYGGGVYVSDNVSVKPKALHQIYQNTIGAIKTYGLSESDRPRIVIVSAEELGAYGKYDAVTNTVYYIPEIVTGNVEIKFGDTEYHEMWHLKQAIDYRKTGKTIALDNKRDYIEALCKQCKRRIDNLGITRYNVGEISEYARRMYGRGRYDEVEAEYMTKARNGA